MRSRRMLLRVMVLVVGIYPLSAATVTYSLNGTLGPNLNNGPDCLNALNQMLVATATASSTQTPIKTTTHSATYQLPAGAITATIGTTTFASTKPWQLIYALAKNPTITLAGAGPSNSSVKSISTLAPGSIPNSVLGKTGHPAPLTANQSPQNLTSPGSNLSYSISSLGCALTKLGFTGTIGSNPAAPITGR